MPAVKAVPDNYPRLIPYIIVDGAKDAIAFYTKVFGAKQRGDVMPAPGGKVGHAELTIGKSVVMLADQDPMLGNKTPKQLGGCPVNLCVYVEDADAVFEAATKNGAKLISAPETKFYGDRAGTFEDPWGYQWTAMTHVEDVSSEEMGKRVEAMIQST